MRQRLTKSAAPGPRTASLPRWLTSKTPTRVRTASCSRMTPPPGYSMGISQPPKSASLAPRATCRAWSAGRAAGVGGVGHGAASSSRVGPDAIAPVHASLPRHNGPHPRSRNRPPNAGPRRAHRHPGPLTHDAVHHASPRRGPPTHVTRADAAARHAAARTTRPAATPHLPPGSALRRQHPATRGPPWPASGAHPARGRRRTAPRPAARALHPGPHHRHAPRRASAHVARTRRRRHRPAIPGPRSPGADPATRPPATAVRRQPAPHPSSHAAPRRAIPGRAVTPAPTPPRGRPPPIPARQRPGACTPAPHPGRRARRAAPRRRVDLSPAPRPRSRRPRTRRASASPACACTLGAQPGRCDLPCPRRGRDDALGLADCGGCAAGVVAAPNIEGRDSRCSGTPAAGDLHGPGIPTGRRSGPRAMTASPAEGRPWPH